MYKTLLFDLDGTLLSLEIGEFLPMYFGGLTARFNKIMPPEEFISNLMASTEVMLSNKEQNLTNMEAFLRDFVPRMPLSREELLAIFNDFYQGEFGKLYKAEYLQPLAKKIVDCALKKGLEVVVATNPIFPRTAIEHRLQWAGLGEYPFKLVTTYEIMHFCKPHIEYYKEILDLIGRAPEDCLMIGNDVQEDLVAREIGISTYLVKDHLINRKAGEAVTDYQGYMEDLYQFVQGL